MCHYQIASFIFYLREISHAWLCHFQKNGFFYLFYLQVILTFLKKACSLLFQNCHNNRCLSLTIRKKKRICATQDLPQVGYQKYKKMSYLNRSEYSCNIVNWTPLILQYIQTYASISIDYKLKTDNLIHK